jgi:dephospho-CoA kinase
MFGQLGAAVLDADAIARELLRPGTAAWREVRRAFGERILRRDGSIDRARLAGVVFRDTRARRRLERILHPRVLRRLDADVRRLSRAGRTRAVVLDVPLLLEVGVAGRADAVVVVRAPRAAQRRRLRAGRGWSMEEIGRRINAQWSLSAKAALADHVIDNGGTRAQTRAQVRRLWQQMM